MDHLNISEQIGEGIYPDEPRVVARWNTDGRAESPIRIAHGPVRGELKANTDTVMPANVAEMLVQSGYEVVVTHLAIVNPEVDAHIDEAIAAMEASRAKAAEVIKLPIDKLKAALVDLDLNALRFALEAEEAEGGARARKGAIEAIEMAIDTLPDQSAALAAAEAAENGASETS